jgi:hypothetical protein
MFRLPGGCTAIAGITVHIGMGGAGTDLKCFFPNQLPFNVGCIPTTANPGVHGDVGDLLNRISASHVYP